MIDVTLFAGRPIAILGLARSGAAAAQALRNGGAAVMGWDDAAPRREAAAAAGIPLVDLRTADLAGVAALVLSPGIPHTYPAPHPIVARARAAGLEIIGDIELLARSRPDAHFVGITGTNGKSTTTALIAHVLAAAGRQVAVGGNLGTPALQLEALGPDGIYVLEMSSYQLELSPNIAFDAGVLLNITPDHLDRHGGMLGYIAAKTRIFEGQGPHQAAVIGIDDLICRDLRESLAGAEQQRVVPISAERPARGGVFAAEGRLIDDLAGAARPVLELGGLTRLPGRHNWQNVAAAYAVARSLGVASETAVAAIESFAGLAHRQELVAVIDGIRYVNDSKATNADAAAKALACYDDIYWIAGGKPKEGGIAPLAAYFPRIRHAFLIGEAAEDFARTLTGTVPVTLAGTLEQAIGAARHAARDHRGATVLLSPACASFDQFSDFEARGDSFRHLVTSLPGEFS